MALTLLLAAMTPLASADGLPKIIAHRGASHAAPENTLAAFKQAWEEGADGIEGDFQLTADGQVVCMHDTNTVRTTGKKFEIGKTLWKDLSALDAGSWKDPRYAGEKIPRLADVLAILPEDKFLFIEVKSDMETVGPIARVLNTQKADPKRVILISFYPEVITECRRRLPQFQAHLISSLKEIDTEGKPSEVEHLLLISGAQGLQFDCKSPFDPQWIGELKKRHLMLASWTVDDSVAARKVSDAGVDFITTNRPGPLREELGR